MPSALDKQAHDRFVRTVVQAGHRSPHPAAVPGVVAAMRAGNPGHVRDRMQAALGVRGNPPHPNAVRPPRALSNVPPAWAIAAAGVAFLAWVPLSWLALRVEPFSAKLPFYALAFAVFVLMVGALHFGRHVQQRATMRAWLAWFAGATAAPRRA